jgi:isopentenyl-diphosphate delta-isomerase
MEEVILVNEKDESIGVMEKMAAHQQAVLHRAFSIFIFNDKNEMLLQQRADEKYHSAGLWTNACCSHPKPGEAITSAAQRRLFEELGFTTPLTQSFSFIYKAEFDNGLSEHEYDHVFTGRYNGDINANYNEVKAWKFVSIEALKQELLTHPANFTAWFHIAFPKLLQWPDLHS